MQAILSQVCVTFVMFTSIVALKHAFIMDERWVCNVKKSCFTCLKLQHCTWCETENKCFSNKLIHNKNCENSTIEFTDYGCKFLYNFIPLLYNMLFLESRLN